MSPVYDVAVTPDLSVSFQRYPRPPAGWVAALPRSCGALPIVVGPAGIAVPCLPGEAVWIGLVRSSVAAPACVVRVVVPAAGEQQIPVPPGYAVTGVPRGDGTFWALGGDDPGLRRLELVASTGADSVTARVELVGAQRFEALTGQRLAPLDEADAYEGWLLP